MRYHLFYRDLCSEDCNLPTKDSLILNSRRANYQAAIHWRSLSQFVSAPPHEEHGWHLEDGKLEMKWMIMPSTPDSIMFMVTCKCSKKGCTPQSRCGCQEAGLLCTELCKCNNCTNTHQHPALAGDTPESDSESDECED